MNTSEQFDIIIRKCKEVFVSKMKDYGTAWRILRTSSITDQIYIKANRIRSIEEKGTSKVNEGIMPEYIGIVNYAVMGLIQLKHPDSAFTDLSEKEIGELYHRYIFAAKALMEDKNHDYDEAWRNMRISSLTDIILMKLLRTKEIENNQGQTLVSEGIDANYNDMINYSIFALIKLEEERNPEFSINQD